MNGQSVKLLDSVESHDWSRGFDSFTSFERTAEGLITGYAVRDALVDCVKGDSQALPARLSVSYARTNTMAIASNAFVEVSIGEATPSESAMAVSTVSEHAVIGCVGPGRIVIDTWNIDEGPTTPKLGPHERRVLEPGQAMAIEAGVAVALDCETRSLVLCVMSRTSGGVRHTFDRGTGEHRISSTSSTAFSHIAYALEFLDTFGRESERALSELSQHSVYFIRWRAIQALTRKNPALGLKRIQVALQDENAQIRDAASRTLEMNGIK